jgi:hypothetical protein
MDGAIADGVMDAAMATGADMATDAVVTVTDASVMDMAVGPDTAAHGPVTVVERGLDTAAEHGLAAAMLVDGLLAEAVTRWLAADSMAAVEADSTVAAADTAAAVIGKLFA